MNKLQFDEWIKTWGGQLEEIRANEFRYKKCGSIKFNEFHKMFEVELKKKEEKKIGELGRSLRSIQ